MRRQSSPLQNGYSLIELMLAISIATTVTGLAVPLVTGTIEHLRAAGAARYLAARIASTRLDAVRRSSVVGLRFEPRGTDYAFTPVLDGNGNGLRALDVAGGVDRPIGPNERLEDQFAGTSIGLLPGIPDLDGVTGSADGLRIGPSAFLSVAPNGSCTSGTVYVHGRRSQFAVRALGATGRVRFFFYDRGTRQWITR
jgi:prepilin-type N-terminal cleavage/methylation domain-containing protein